MNATPEPVPVSPATPGSVRRTAGLLLQSRLTVLAWSVWLLGSWLVSLALEGPIRAARGMLFASLIGLMVVYPVIRLSVHVPYRSPLGQVWNGLIDAVSLVLVFQAVIWPLQLVTDWPTAQVWWLNATIAVWALFAAGITTLGCLTPRGSFRTLAAGACVLMLLAEPTWTTIGRTSAELASGQTTTWNLSPVGGVVALTSESVPGGLNTWAARALATGLAAAVVWGVVFWLAARDTRASEPELPEEA